MTAIVKERPILMSAPMVQAILAGTKTQTRRVVKWNNHAGVNLSFSGLSLDSSASGRAELYSRDGDGCWQERAKSVCPYGKPGDRLWVRETWYDDLCPRQNGDHSLTTTYGSGDDTWESPCVYYRADGEPDFEGATTRWRPSIFMPRWASRITLEITDVRVQRLQEISEEDCLAEGIDGTFASGVRVGRHLLHEMYRELWESINGPSSWDANPWVWAVSFRRIEIDTESPRTLSASHEGTVTSSKRTEGQETPESRTA